MTFTNFNDEDVSSKHADNLTTEEVEGFNLPLEQEEPIHIKQEGTINPDDPEPIEEQVSKLFCGKNYHYLFR